MIPFDLDFFWLKVAWDLGKEDEGSHDERWDSSERRKERQTIAWWPAYVEVEGYEQKTFKLWYTRRASSFSDKDLSSGSKHSVLFLPSNWLKHGEGQEKGKLCSWRYACKEEKSYDNNGKRGSEEICHEENEEI